jgi:hypothetical protein
MEAGERWIRSEAVRSTAGSIRKASQMARGKRSVHGRRAWVVRTTSYRPVSSSLDGILGAKDEMGTFAGSISIKLSVPVLRQFAVLCQVESRDCWRAATVTEHARHRRLNPAGQKPPLLFSSGGHRIGNANGAVYGQANTLGGAPGRRVLARNLET